MPTIRLTAKNVPTLEAEATRVDYFDQASPTPGFGLRVFPSGHRTWFLIYRANGRQKRHGLGTFPALGLADARTAARNALHGWQVERVDPASAKLARRTGLSVADLAAKYVELYAKPKKKKKSRQYDESQLRRFVLPAWKSRPAFEVTKRDCSDLLDDVVKNSGGVSANRLRSVLSKMFRWAVSKDLLERNPMEGIGKPAKETPRDRELTDPEILIFWNRVAWAEQEGVIPPGVALWCRLRLLTAQRAECVHPMKWANVDPNGGVWEIPGVDMKSGKPHVVPLAPFVCRLLNDRRAIAPADDVFVMEGGRSGALRRGIESVFSPVLDNFQLRDLRRTAATGMGRLKVPRFIVVRVLGHIDRSQTATYDRWEYLEEKREALNKWAAHVIGVVGLERIDAEVQRILEGQRGVRS